MSKLCNLCDKTKEDSEVIRCKCSHIFCLKCLNGYISKTLNNVSCSLKIHCPLLLCGKEMRDNEIRATLSEEDITIYERLCCNQFNNLHECILVGCGRANILEDIEEDNFYFTCHYCGIFNCVKCKDAHIGMKCNESISRNGELRKNICEVEVLRAQNILKTKEAKHNRQNIIKASEDNLTPNNEIFECNQCNKCIGLQSGVYLKQCFHKICRPCLEKLVTESLSSQVRCPIEGCNKFLDDRECRAISEEIYEEKSLAEASKTFNKKGKCGGENCKNLCEIDRKLRNWTCPLCNFDNNVAAGDNQVKNEPFEYQKLVEHQSNIKTPKKTCVAM